MAERYEGRVGKGEDRKQVKAREGERDRREEDRK